uniref:Uncharacterized protein n=1 Tax=Anguilla anguilla TaxID=7936 RepID=A0A0E9V7W0_ANGAN
MKKSYLLSLWSDIC